MFKYFSRNHRLLRQYRKTVAKIRESQEGLNALSDQELKQRAASIITEIRTGGNPKQDDCPRFYALVCEAAFRILGLQAYDVQLIGALALDDNKIAELKTGEGKTLVAAFSALWQFACGRKTHVLTVNDYLSERDWHYLEPLYSFFGAKSRFNRTMTGTDKTGKPEVFAADILYSSHQELVFDYLRSHLADSRQWHYFPESLFEETRVIIDEADMILIDEAKIPLLLSDKAESNPDDLAWAWELTATFKQSPVDMLAGSRLGERFSKEGMNKEQWENYQISLESDFYLHHNRHSISLFEKGIEKIEASLGRENLWDDPVAAAASLNLVENALLARYALVENGDYIVQDGKVLLIDSHTGRILPDSQLRGGLHQALEHKHGLAISPKQKILGKITYQSFFNLYPQRCGMTGTAQSEAYELFHIYGMETVVIPQNRPLIRKDYPDRLFIDSDSQMQAIWETLQDAMRRGQPVLVGTPFLYISENLSEVLREQGIYHSLLNAKHHQREAQIIAQAGICGTITIATNMAGRGTDIILGGNTDFMADNFDRITQEGGHFDDFLATLPAVYTQHLKNCLKDCPHPDRDSVLAALKSCFQQEREKAFEAGGLLVIGIGKNNSRRIDLQLIGRSGRQGEVGESRFFLSIDEELIQENHNDKLIALIKTVTESMETASNGEMWMLNQIPQQAQKICQERNFASRKWHWQSDKVLDKQRKIFYRSREHIYDWGMEDVWEFLEEACFSHIMSNIPQLSDDGADRDDLKAPLRKLIGDFIGLSETALKDRVSEMFKDFFTDAENFWESENLAEMACKSMIRALQLRWQPVEQTYGINETYFQQALLRTYDECWSEHLDELDELFSASKLSAYAGKDPQRAYEQQAFDLFMKLKDKASERFWHLISHEDLDKNFARTEDFMSSLQAQELLEKARNGEDIKDDVRHLAARIATGEILAANQERQSD